MEGLGDYGSSSEEEAEVTADVSTSGEQKGQEQAGAGAGAAAATSLVLPAPKQMAQAEAEMLEGEVLEDVPVECKSKVWTARLPRPPKRKVLSLPAPSLDSGATGPAVALDTFKLTGTTLARGNDEEGESRHKKARVQESARPSGLLGMLPKAKCGESATDPVGGRRIAPQAKKRSAAEAQAAYEAMKFPQAAPREQAALADEQIVTLANSATSPKLGPSQPDANLVASTGAASAAQATSPTSAVASRANVPSGTTIRDRKGLSRGFAMPGITAAPEVAPVNASIAQAPGQTATAASSYLQHYDLPQQQQPHHNSHQKRNHHQLQHQNVDTGVGGVSEEMLSSMTKRERMMLTANMGNLIDLNPQTMRQGAEEWVQPGGEGFVSQFEGKAAKPGMRSKQKHQITSLVYDLAQKEGDILERQGKNFQTKKQTWGKYGWA